MGLAAMADLFDEAEFVKLLGGADDGCTVDAEQGRKPPNTGIALAGALVEMVDDRRRNALGRFGKARHDVERLVGEQDIVLLKDRHITPPDRRERAPAWQLQWLQGW